MARLPAVEGFRKRLRKAPTPEAKEAALLQWAAGVEKRVAFLEIAVRRLSRREKTTREHGLLLRHIEEMVSQILDKDPWEKSLERSRAAVAIEEQERKPKGGQ